VIGDLLVMEEAEQHTIDTGDGDGFHCLICGHYVIYTNETEWGALNWRGLAFSHMRGTEPFHYCPNCGREILTQEQWIEKYPDDMGKTYAEIRKRYV